MATEGPLIHDGSQNTANSDLSTGLDGQGGSGQFLAVKIAGNRLVDLQSTPGAAIYGILQNKPTAGQAADVGIAGVTKAMSGGSISAGDLLMVVDSAGRLGTAATTAARVGVSLETVATSSVVFSCAIVPAEIGTKS